MTTPADPNAVPPVPPVPPGTGTPPVVPPVDPPDPETFTLSKDALSKRNDRAARSRLVELFGTDDPVKLEAIKAAATEAEKRRLADMSEVERAKAEAAAEKARADQTTALLTQERFNNTVSRTCATLGIKNLDYAAFEIERASKKLGAGGELDIEAHLKGMLAQPTAAAALGIERPIEQQTTPITTTPAIGQPPPPPPPGTPPPPAKSAMEMNPAEFAAHVQRMS